MLDYFWRVILTDEYGNYPVTVALFALESDARTWAEEESKEPDSGNYAVLRPKKTMR